MVKYIFVKYIFELGLLLPAGGARRHEAKPGIPQPQTEQNQRGLKYEDYCKDL